MAGGQTSRSGDRKDEALMGGMVKLIPYGATPSPSPAATGAPVASPRRLNPAFSLWLQGFPVSWMLCGMLAHLSLASQKRPKATRSPGQFRGA